MWIWLWSVCVLLDCYLSSECVRKNRCLFTVNKLSVVAALYLGVVIANQREDRACHCSKEMAISPEKWIKLNCELSFNDLGSGIHFDGELLGVGIDVTGKLEELLSY